MKYALLSDIHANLPALDAVLAHLQSRSEVDAIYHLGDLVGYATWPNEVVETLQREGIAGVAGNYDSTVGTDYKHCGCKYENPEQEQQSHESFEWTKRNTSPAAKSFLAALPFRIDVRPKGGHSSGPKLILVHGTPTLNTLYWTEDRDDAFCLRMAETGGAKAGDVIAFGHTHLPWHRQVEGIHFVNTGSVGRPKDGDWRAGFTLVGFSDNGVTVEHSRIEYDANQSAAAIRASDLPHAFADHLLTGRTSGNPDV